MTAFLTVALLSALLVAPDSAAAPAAAEFKIWAVEVHKEGRKAPHFDKGLEEVRETVQDSKHDTYINLKTTKHTFKGDKSVSTALTDRYTLTATPPTVAGDGRYRVNLRLTMKSEKKPGATSLLQPDSLIAPDNTRPKDREIEALSSDLLLQPDKKVVIRGLKLEDGKEMILVVSLSVPDKENEAAR